jgi:tRNA1(Val) A37 N6-methylase TrmN6
MPFRTKTFAIDDERCGMRVGTDAFLLGLFAGHRTRARSEAGRRQPTTLLDVGTGSGVVALTFAHVFLRWTAERKTEVAGDVGPMTSSDALHIVGVDIDADAVGAARQNIEQAIRTNQVATTCTTEVHQIDITRWGAASAEDEQGADLPPHGFDVVLCCPPYFDPRLELPKHKAGTTAMTQKRRWARMRSSLELSDLCRVTLRAMRRDGGVACSGRAYVAYPFPEPFFEFCQIAERCRDSDGSPLRIDEVALVWDTDEDRLRCAGQIPVASEGSLPATTAQVQMELAALKTLNFAVQPVRALISLLPGVPTTQGTEAAATALTPKTSVTVTALGIYLSKTDRQYSASYLPWAREIYLNLAVKDNSPTAAGSEAPLKSLRTES